MRSSSAADWLKRGTWAWDNGHYAAWKEWGAHACVVIQSEGLQDEPSHGGCGSNYSVECPGQPNNHTGLCN